MLRKVLNGRPQKFDGLAAIILSDQARQIARRSEMIEARTLTARCFDRFDKRTLRLSPTTFLQQEAAP